MPSSFFPKGLLRRRAVTVPTSFSGREMMKRMPKSKNPKELEAFLAFWVCFLLENARMLGCVML